MVLERNGDYWEKDLPILERIEFRIIPEETARLPPSGPATST